MDRPAADGRDAYTAAATGVQEDCAPGTAAGQLSPGSRRGRQRRLPARDPTRTGSSRESDLQVPSAPSRGMNLSEVAWTDVAEADTDLALFPVGSTEQHGPHAPLGTDVLTAEAVARAGADRYGERHGDRPARSEERRVGKEC